MDTSNVMIELGLLHLHRPPFGASPVVEAAWHREQAVVLEHLGCTDQADVVRAHADLLDHTNDDGLAVAA